jgi:diguanylate cyclase (GGDEF)-like protein
MDNKDWLRRAEIFASLDDSGLEHISGYSESVSYSTGEKIFSEGDRSGVLYIITAGSVQIIRNGAYEGSTLIAELVPGDIMGELEFFTGADFNATAVASADTTALRIPGKGGSFRVVIDNNPGIAAFILYEFLKVISRRIRSANSLVRENSAIIQELKRQVYGDKLTGLYNKTYLEETLPDYMKNRSEPVGLLLMKPDNFKYINDTFGHEAGDETLKIMAAALNHFMSERGIVLRYMGNELGVILPGCGRDESFAEARKILAMFNTLDISKATKTDEVFLSMSIGVAVFPGHGDVADDLISNAHALPLVGRDRGGNIILFPEDTKA